VGKATTMAAAERTRRARRGAVAAVRSSPQRCFAAEQREHLVTRPATGRHTTERFCPRADTQRWHQTAIVYRQPWFYLFWFADAFYTATRKKTEEGGGRSQNHNRRKRSRRSRRRRRRSERNRSRSDGAMHIFSALCFTNRIVFEVTPDAASGRYRRLLHPRNNMALRKSEDFLCARLSERIRVLLEIISLVSL